MNGTHNPPNINVSPEQPQIPCYAFTLLFDLIDQKCFFYGLLNQMRGQMFSNMMMETNLLRKFTADLFEDNQINRELSRSNWSWIGRVHCEGRPSTFRWFEREGSLTAKAADCNEYLCKQFEYLEILRSTNITFCLSEIRRGWDCVFNWTSNWFYHVSRVALVMTHIATFNALAFVQPFKRKRRFMYHDPENRFAIILEGNHRSFIYNRHEGVVRNMMTSL